MKNMRLLQTVLAVICVLTTVFCFACAEAEGYPVDWGYCSKSGTSVGWTFYSDGKLSITGKGAMKDYDLAYTPWYQYNESIISVEIAKGVSSIGTYAFGSCKSIKGATIAASVESIGKGAFQACTALEEVTVLDDDSESSVLVSIGEEAFRDCCNLTDINLPDSLTSIGKYAFNNCPVLKSISIPEGVTSILPYTFRMCYAAESLSLPDGLKDIGYQGFNNCRHLTSITLPAKLETIGDEAFSSCYRLKNVTVLNDNTRFGNDVFKNCDSKLTITCGCTSTKVQAYAKKNGFATVLMHAKVDRDGYCPLCGAIPRPSSVPETGDRAHPVLWSVMIVLSFAGILALSARRKQAR